MLVLSVITPGQPDRRWQNLFRLPALALLVVLLVVRLVAFLAQPELPLVRLVAEL
jgi:hypothetical protein